MPSQKKRILWLLNHKTLMPYEVNLLLDLGFEVFTPKILPSHSIRNFTIDFSYDLSLTIPHDDLKRLNEFNFYEDSWPSDIVNIVNQYFNLIFVIPFGTQVSQALEKFAGQIAFRAFGLENTETYLHILQVIYGEQILTQIYNLGSRFWFAEGYEQLHECEPPLLAKQALFLPLGLPSSFWKNANQWNGSIKKILFICPNIMTDSYYSAIYKQFKKDFGDLPHIIIGAQDTPIDDPHVLGFVTNQELEQLYLDCAVLYYHSKELRHVHYSPIEAAINGMPIVYFRNSLLDRVCKTTTSGCVDTVEEARSVIKRIIINDEEFIIQLRDTQRNLAYYFSDEYCRPIWNQNLSHKNLETKSPESRIRSYLRKVWQTIFNPIPTIELLPPKLKTVSDHLSLTDGIDFTAPHYPSFVTSITGVSEHEAWGRWSDGATVSITLEHLLHQSFKLILVGGAYDKNVGKKFKIKIGNVVRTAQFCKDPTIPETLILEFTLRKPTNVIKIKVPYPSTPEGDSRAIGLGFKHLSIEK